MGDFFDKDSSRAYEQVKEALYAQLKMVENNIAEYNDKENDPDFEDTYGEGYLNSLSCQLFFLRNLIDKMERS